VPEEKEPPSEVQAPASSRVRYAEQMGELRNAIGNFLTDFAWFESVYLTEALKGLSSDPMLVEHLPELMELSRRLKLMKYLGAAQNLPQTLRDDISHVCNVARKISEIRNEIAHGPAALTGVFLMDPEAQLTPGVQRPRSKRAISRESLTPEQLKAMNLEWIHDLPSIREWTGVTVELQAATRHLASKLDRYRRGEPWEGVTVRRLTLPVKKDSGKAAKKSKG
jgi:hypothetical protein